jgi:hypothetical protein
VSTRVSVEEEQVNVLFPTQLIVVENFLSKHVQMPEGLYGRVQKTIILACFILQSNVASGGFARRKVKITYLLIEFLLAPLFFVASLYMCS